MPTKEIKLSKRFQTLIAQLKSILDETSLRNQQATTRLNDLLTAICLNEDVDLEKFDVLFNEDITALRVIPKAVENTEQETEPVEVKKSAKRAKI